MAALLAVAFAVAMLPSSAFGNSLLSGYGGPGAGSQQILGSTLIGGSEGAGSAGTGGGAAGSVAPTTPGEQGAAPPSSSQHTASGQPARAHARPGTSAPRSSTRATQGGTRAIELRPAASTSVALGLSGEGVFLLLLGFVALLAVAVLLAARAQPWRTG